jgi:flagellar M-ring protein FliF
MIKLRAGGDLGKKQIKGIMNLVAGSVEGLKPENVSIVDTLGNLLSPSDDERSEEFGGEATRIQYQREIEKGYVQRIEQMLSKVVGAGKVIARVTADLDYSSNERQEESFDPGGQVIRSERTVSEGSGGGAARGGVPGVISNLTNDPKLLAPQDGSRDGAAGSRSESVKNYEVSRAVVKSSSPRGILKRLSVAVLVDGNYEEVPAATGAPADATAVPPPKRIFKPLTSEVLSQIDEVVKSAVGFDMARGDTLRVENVQFAQVQDEVAKALESKATQDYVFLAVSWSGILLFTIMFFFFLVRPLVAQITTTVESEVNLERLLPTGLQDLERELEVERAKSKKAALPETDEGIDLEHLEQLMGENSKLVQENPRQAALLIRYWLGEG